MMAQAHLMPICGVSWWCLCGNHAADSWSIGGGEDIMSQSQHQQDLIDKCGGDDDIKPQSQHQQDLIDKCGGGDDIIMPQAQHHIDDLAVIFQNPGCILQPPIAGKNLESNLGRLSLGFLSSHLVVLMDGVVMSFWLLRPRFGIHFLLCFRTWQLLVVGILVSALSSLA